MKENGNILSISKAEFIKLVSDNSGVYQYSVRAVLEAMEDTLVDLFKQMDKYDKVKVRVSRNIQMGARMRKATRRRLPDTGEIVEVEAKLEPFCKYLTSFLEQVRT